MQWLDTTNPNSVLDKYGHFTCYLPFLPQCPTSELKPCFTVHKKHQYGIRPDYWSATIWVGNRGLSVDNWTYHKTKEEAQESCRKFLLEMKKKLNEFVI